LIGDGIGFTVRAVRHEPERKLAQTLAWLRSKMCIDS
jgi:hypothetical protein